jgi:tetratricopeptide (TPR) repeat protein
MNKWFLVLIILLAGLGFAPPKKAKTPAVPPAPPTVEGLVLAGKAGEAARLAAKSQGAFEEAVKKLLSDADNQVTDRKIEEAQKTLTASDAFLKAYATVDKGKALPQDAVRGRLLRLEGIQLNDKKDYENAETTLRQALDISQKAEDTLLEAGVHNNLGYALRYQQKLGEAAKEFGAAAQMAESQKDDLRAGSYNINLGEVQLLQGHPEMAIPTLKRAVEQNRAASRPEREARALLLQGTALGKMDLRGGNETILQDSLQLFKQAVEIYERIGDERNAGISLFMMANKVTVAERWDQAASFAERAAAHFAKAGDRPGQRTCYAFLAEMYKKLGNAAKAAQNLKLANEIK